MMTNDDDHGHDDDDDNDDGYKIDNDIESDTCVDTI